MFRCKTCRAWPYILNTDGLCKECVKTLSPDRSPLELFVVEGSLRVEGSTIIHKKDSNGKETMIPIANIQEFIFRPPSDMMRGSIKIVTAKSGGGVVGVAGGGGFIGVPLSLDLEVTLIHSGELPYAQNIRKYVADFQTNANAPTVSISVADELTKLKALLDDGALTQEEFDRKKNKLLGE